MWKIIYNQTMKTHFIGLDPGRNTGFALWNATKQRFDSLGSTDFWGVIDKVKTFSNIYPIAAIVIENPALNQPVFMSKAQKDELTGAFQEMNKCARKHEAGFNSAITTVESAIKVHSKKAQNVGRNKEQAFLLIDWLERNNFKIIEIRPSIPKVDHVGFCELTGWTKKTNEHSRDAGRLVYKLEPQP